MFKTAIAVIGTWLLVLFGCMLVLASTSIAPGLAVLGSIIVASLVAGRVAKSFDGEL